MTKINDLMTNIATSSEREYRAANDLRSTDFEAVRALLGDRGWYPEDGVREILCCDAGRVRLLVTERHFMIEFGDPFLESGGVAEILMPRDVSYGLVRVMAEQVRTVAHLTGHQKGNRS